MHSDLQVSSAVNRALTEEQDASQALDNFRTKSAEMLAAFPDGECDFAKGHQQYEAKLRHQLGVARQKTKRYPANAAKQLESPRYLEACERLQKAGGDPIYTASCELEFDEKSQLPLFEEMLAKALDSGLDVVQAARWKNPNASPKRGPFDVVETRYLVMPHWHLEAFVDVKKAFEEERNLRGLGYTKFGVVLPTTSMTQTAEKIGARYDGAGYDDVCIPLGGTAQFPFVGKRNIGDRIRDAIVRMIKEAPGIQNDRKHPNAGATEFRFEDGRDPVRVEPYSDIELAEKQWALEVSNESALG
ncbi:hypothetical protein SAMN02745129_2441 [Ferrimonas marina]|uniref:Uncharacterized protein n=1 Tax=Ferrimonas marina TaxID=299255 RepID=A0A1M5U7C6_9GAMM|nr:hypothetical protein SAMN02745129_2441 [Ferrimonas marina]